MRYFVDGSVFDLFPGYRRGVVVALGVENGPSPEELREMLAEACARARQRFTSAEALSQDPRVRAWREAYRRLKVDPTRFRPSMEALLRRVLSGEDLPSFGVLVDLGNYLSVKHVLPVGAHALDELAGDLELRRARGEETFVPLNSEGRESPDPGEVILAEGSWVLTRRWTWRQGRRSLVVDSTKEVEFNVDALPPVGDEELKGVMEELKGLIERFAKPRDLFSGVLRAESPSMRLKGV